MANAQLENYVKKARSESIPDDIIKKNLISVGWAGDEIGRAMINDSDIPLPPDIPRPPHAGYASMWDGFEHILMFLSLYFMATAIALILHQFVDRWSPGLDTFGFYYYASYYSESILRASLACLIVTFPLFAFFHLDINKRTLKNQQLRMLRSRRFFIYLTLIGTFLIMIGKTIQTINNFLAGNITVNFLLHLLVTVGISTIIFIYYLSQVREDRKAYA